MGVGPGEKFFGPSCNGGSAKRILYDNCLDVPKKNKHAMPGTKIKHDIGVENVYS
jgi:hypothetical protein